MRELLSIGVDLGGTKTEAVVLRRANAEAQRGGPDYEVLARLRRPTPAAEGYDAILSSTTELVRDVARSAGVALRALPLGVGMPGAVERRSNLVKNSNTTCLNGRPFRDDLSSRVGQRIVFENDANCFALAEACLGAAREFQKDIVFGAILGTGVGGGLVIGGRVWAGPQQLAGEWGHHAVGPWRRPREMLAEGSGLGLALRARPLCYCGRTGCLELYASGKAVELDYVRRGGPERPLKDIAELAARGADPSASAAIDELLEAFGRAVANLIDILDPAAIVLGGGVSNVDALYSAGIERVRAYVFNDELTTPILRNALGDSAGVLGAALLAS